MDHPTLVGVLQCRSDCPGNLQCVIGRKLALSAEPFSQSLSFYVGHDVVEEPSRFAGIEQRQDMRMLELGGEADLAEEAIGPEHGSQVGPEYFDGDKAIVLEFVRQIHRRHAAPPELTLDGVAAGEVGRESCEEVS